MPSSRAALSLCSLAISSAIGKSMSSYKLTYFDFGGRAEPIRLAFKVGGIDFEDNRISFQEFGAMKQSGELPHGQVPILEIGGVKYSQSNSLLRYVGKLAGLYPEDPVQAMLVDSYLDFNDDFFAPIGATMARKRLGLPDMSGEEKKTVREKIASELLPPMLEQMETKLADNGTGWCVGDSCTIADLKWYCQIKNLLSGRLDHIPVDIVDPYPLTKGIIEKVDAIPAVQEWNDAIAKRKAEQS